MNKNFTTFSVFLIFLIFSDFLLFCCFAFFYAMKNCAQFCSAFFITKTYRIFIITASNNIVFINLRVIRVNGLKYVNAKSIMQNDPVSTLNLERSANNKILATSMDPCHTQAIIMTQQKQRAGIVRDERKSRERD